MTLYVPCILLQSVDNKRDGHFLKNKFYSTVFSRSTCFERITRSSSGALPSILYHAVWYNRAGESSCYEVAWYSILGSAPDDELVIRSKRVEQEKKGLKRNIYKELCISLIINTLPCHISWFCSFSLLWRIKLVKIQAWPPFFS